MSLQRSGWFPRSLMLMGFLALVLSIFAVGGKSVVNAAGGEPQVSISNGKYTDVNDTVIGPDQVVYVAQLLNYSADWRIETNVEDGDQFTVSLPDSMRLIVGNSFPLYMKNSDGSQGDVLAQCDYTFDGIKNRLLCKFQGSHVGPVEGFIWFQVSYLTSVADTREEFEIGSSVAVLPETGGAVYPSTPVIREIRKNGSINLGNRTLSWVIYVPYGRTSAVIEDAISFDYPNKTHYLDSAYMRLVRYQVILDDNGDPVFSSASREIVYDDGALTGNAAGEQINVIFSDPIDDAATTAKYRAFSVELGNLSADHVYRLEYASKVPQGHLILEGDKFSNTVSGNVGETSQTVEVTATGGGGGSGVTFVDAAVRKVFGEGTDPGVLGVDQFAVDAWVEGEEPVRFYVPADGSLVTSPSFPSDTDVFLREVLPVVEGVVWEDFTLSMVEGSGGSLVRGGDGVYVLNAPEGANIELVLTNAIEQPQPPVDPNNQNETSDGKGNVPTSRLPLSGLDGWSLLAVIVLAAVGSSFYGLSRFRA